MTKSILGAGLMACTASCLIMLWGISNDYLTTMHDNLALQSIHASNVSESELFAGHVMKSALTTNGGN